MFRICLLTAGLVIFAVHCFERVMAEENDSSMCIPMDAIIIEAPETIEPKKASVEFPHAIHFKYTCKTCHHTWDMTSQIISCKAAGCHDAALNPKKEGGKVDPELAIRYYKAAYHTACIGCHKEIKQQNKLIEKTYLSPRRTIQHSGPTGCSECHPR